MGSANNQRKIFFFTRENIQRKLLKVRQKWLKVWQKCSKVRQKWSKVWQKWLKVQQKWSKVRQKWLKVRQKWTKSDKNDRNLKKNNFVSFLLNIIIKYMLEEVSCTVIPVYNNHPWYLKKAAVWHRCLIKLRFRLVVDDSNWPLWTGGRCSQVVVKSGLTVDWNK